MMNEILLVLIVQFQMVTTSPTCSSSLQTSSVIDICSSRTVVEDSFDKNILLQVTTTEECHCTLSITDHIQPINVRFRNYKGDTSTPSSNGCGVDLLVESINGIFGQYHCDISDTIYTVPTNSSVKIYTRSTAGLNENAGYCLELSIDSGQNYYNDPNVKLTLSCINPLIEYTTTEKKTSSTEKFTTSTLDPKGDNDLILYASIGAICSVFVLVCVLVTTVIFRMRVIKKNNRLTATRSKNQDNARQLQQSSEDQLPYNSLYQPSPARDIHIVESNTHTDKKVKPEIEICGHYADIDVFQHNKRTVPDKQDNIPEKSKAIETIDIEDGLPNSSDHKCRPNIIGDTTAINVYKSPFYSVVENEPSTIDNRRKKSYIYAVVNKTTRQ